MAKGTSAGLVDTPKAQSVFKHEILRRYLNIWSNMVPSGSSDAHLYIVDGYAGPGRFVADGQPASGSLLLESAKRATAPVTCFLVERDRVHFSSLSKVVAEYVSQGVDGRALPGDIAAHMPTIINAAIGKPLFLFLDPCGRPQPFQSLADVLANQRPRFARPATELLINFSADYIRRVGGAWLAGELPPEQTKQLLLELELDEDPAVDPRSNEAHAADLTASLGGTWWQDVVRRDVSIGTGSTWQTAVENIAAGYAQGMAKDTGMKAVIVPVRRKSTDNQPIYHLAFFTRSAHGLWMFADSVSRARPAYMEAQEPDDEAPDGGLFTTERSVADRCKADQLEAEPALVANIRALATTVPDFRPIDHTHTIFGQTLGIATETQVFHALKALVTSGEIQLIEKSKRPREDRYCATAPTVRAVDGISSHS